MTVVHDATLMGRLAQASAVASRKFDIAAVPTQRLEDALSNAVDPQKLLDNLSEAWRTSPTEAESILQSHGFGGVLARLQQVVDLDQGDETEGPALSSQAVYDFGGGHLLARGLNPGFDEPVRAPQSALDAVATPLSAFLPSADEDALGILYRTEPLAYARTWLRTTAPKVDEYVRQHFGEGGPRYLVNSGIGANEQFNYFVAARANARPDCRTTWLLANSPKEIASLPPDATVDNTLFMEFSRSGITEETVKLHELTPGSARRIVFANSGSLKALGQRDDNLVLALPSEVSGRYGRNKTPILMAPMHVAGLDVESYWTTIEEACAHFDLSSRSSLPVVLAQFLRLQQLRNGVNHIYLGTNDSVLCRSADEFCQYWNEGVNRGANDMTMSRYLGLPRDSHMNLEAMLGTSARKIAVFLIRTSDVKRHPLLLEQADCIEEAHTGLTPGQVDLVLSMANVQRCSEKMPTVLIAVDRIDLASSAWLGQLWADTTLVYSRLIGVDPGSNPEVKEVRTRAAELLKEPDRVASILRPGG